MLNFFKNLFNKKEKAPKRTIVAINTNKKDTIKKVKLSNGEVIDIKRAIELTELGLLDGVEVINIRNGHKALRAIPDEHTNNNLKDLPRF